jgi:hypothetical protein
MVFFGKGAAGLSVVKEIRDVGLRVYPNETFLVRRRSA